MSTTAQLDWKNIYRDVYRPVGLTDFSALSRPMFAVQNSFVKTAAISPTHAALRQAIKANQPSAPRFTLPIQNSFTEFNFATQNELINTDLIDLYERFRESVDKLDDNYEFDPLNTNENGGGNVKHVFLLFVFAIALFSLIQARLEHPVAFNLAKEVVDLTGWALFITQVVATAIDRIDRSS